MNPQFLTFEILILLTFLACLYHASRQGLSRVWELLLSVLYGVLLEWMTLRQLSAYSYGQFLVMIDGAPLCIGVGWAIIIYSGMEYVKQLDIPMIARPFLVGFLALNVDLAMDVIAIRQGFWTWAIPMNAHWFGVPWGNFWAWYIVVSSYSGSLYLFHASGWRDSTNALKRWAYVPVAVVASTLILALTNYFYASVIGPDNLSGLLAMLLLLLAGGFVIIIFRPKVAENAKIEGVSMAVPLIFHIYFNWVGFQNGFYREIPVLGVIGMLMLILGVFIHLYPAWKEKRRRSLAAL